MGLLKGGTVMTMQKATYSEVRNRVLAGDVIAFLGDNPVSKVIDWMGKSGVSHVGIIVEEGTAGQEPRFAESSVHVDDKKLQYTVEVSSFRLSVEAYKGAVWWLPMAVAARQDFHKGTFDKFIGRATGQPFDPSQGLQVVLRDLVQKHIRMHPAVEVEPHIQKGYCCSVLVARALTAAAVVTIGDPEKASPGDVCSWSIYAPDYYLLKGDAELRIYNSLPPGQA